MRRVEDPRSAPATPIPARLAPVNQGAPVSAVRDERAAEPSTPTSPSPPPPSAPGPRPTNTRARLQSWPNAPLERWMLLSAPGDRAKVQAVLAVGVLRIGAHRLVEGVGVVADEDPPLPGAHAVEDDRRRLLGGERRVVAEHLAEQLHQVLDVVVRQSFGRQPAARHLRARL